MEQIKKTDEQQQQLCFKGCSTNCCDNTCSIELQCCNFTIVCNQDCCQDQCCEKDGCCEKGDNCCEISCNSKDSCCKQQQKQQACCSLCPSSQKEQPKGCCQ